MPTTAYDLLRSQCGLSMPEAAQFSRVSEGDVRSWSTGRREAPLAMLTKLRTLDRTITAVAQSLREQIQTELDRWPKANRDTRLLIIADCKSVEIARARGLPFPSVWHVAVARALVELPDDVRLELEARHAKAPAVTTQDLLASTDSAQ
jgi:hypothetical protein